MLYVETVLCVETMQNVETLLNVETMLYVETTMCVEDVLHFHVATQLMLNLWLICYHTYQGILQYAFHNN